MSFSVISLTCPSCGATVSLENKHCKYCDSPLTYSELNSVWEMDNIRVKKYLNSYAGAASTTNNIPEVNFSAGMCCLKLRLFDKAFAYFDRAISCNFNNAEAYFYAAISLLNGKKAFLLRRDEIDKVEANIKAALAIEPRGIFYYFWAYIKYDYYNRKFLNTKPDFKECLSVSEEKNVTDFDKKMLFDIIGVSKPSGF